MAAVRGKRPAPTKRQLHIVGVASGIAAGAWLGSAEAPTKLVDTGISPFVISAAMVMGVFVARWTVPTLIKGTRYVFADLRAMPHLIVWGIMAGALWAVANTLTVFAIKDVGLAVAFPIWNSNSLVGLVWGWLLFNELKGASRKQWMIVAAGAVAIVVATAILGGARTASQPAGQAMLGVLAALGAGLLWGTMYVPYRKAYLSGMNPLSFVTIFTVGELVTVSVLAIAFLGGPSEFGNAVAAVDHNLFWLFLGGFFWVLGDLFQQFAAKYIGVGRGIPLANTNQLWGVAWAALVFYEFKGSGTGTIIAVIGGTLLMLCGAAAIASAQASGAELAEWDRSTETECRRYRLELERVRAAVAGKDPLADVKRGRAWWDILIVLAATAVFVVLAVRAEVPSIPMNFVWLAVIVALAVVTLLVVGSLLRRYTGFS